MFAPQHSRPRWMDNVPVYFVWLLHRKYSLIMPAFSSSNNTGLIPCTASGFSGYCLTQGLQSDFGTICTGGIHFNSPTSEGPFVHNACGISAKSFSSSFSRYIACHFVSCTVGVWWGPSQFGFCLENFPLSLQVVSEWPHQWRNSSQGSSTLVVALALHICLG